MDILEQCSNLENDSIIAEYVWLDGYYSLRSKIRVLDRGMYSIDNMPIWNYDGSSTKQGSAEQSEVILRPVQLYQNPFHKGGYLVLCETYIQGSDGVIQPHPTNRRYKAMTLFEQEYTDNYQPWFGLEQEYYLFDNDGKPFGNAKPKPQGFYYCGNNPEYMKGRQIVEAHLKACLYAGLKVSGVNAEVGPSQWEYQIGPVTGIAAADQLWISRYIMQRIVEQAGCRFELHPKPLGYDWAGSGCHINFSTVQMRHPGGYFEIERVISNLNSNHDTFIKVCGEDSDKRLTGDHETAMISNFSCAIGSRTSSIRIPKETYLKQCGYFEDRRPSSNIDPYLVCPIYMAAVVKQEASDEELLDE